MMRLWWTSRKGSSGDASPRDGRARQAAATRSVATAGGRAQGVRGHGRERQQLVPRSLTRGLEATALITTNVIHGRYLFKIVYLDTTYYAYYY